jgi:glucose/arabinose dehydrogenase
LVKSVSSTELDTRIRDVKEGPDGALYVLTDRDGGWLLKLRPAEGSRLREDRDK